MNMGSMQQRHLQQVSSPDIYVTTNKIVPLLFYMNIIGIVQWLSYSYIHILHYSSAFARRHILFKPRNNFKQTRVDFLPLKYDVISQVSHNYAKGPFSMTRFNINLIYLLWPMGQSTTRFGLHSWAHANRGL